MTAQRYASATEVSTEKSRAEIERTLTRYGASAFIYGWEENRALIMFKARDRHIRFVLALPDPKERRFLMTSRGMRTPEKARAEWEQACRQSWRALALVIKAKLEAIEAKISTFENEFLANVVLPDGSTFGQWAGPEIARAYELGDMPKTLLLGHGGGAEQ